MKRETVSPWHPWPDKPGVHHSIISTIPQGLVSAEEIVEYVGRNQLYVLCQDIMSQEEFPESDALLAHPRTESYLQKHGKIVAMRLRAGRYSGFLIPSRTWNHAAPGPELVNDMQEAFRLVGHQGITPGSTSEKVLRATLPKYHGIYRPSVDLRQVLLTHNGGARIDETEISALYPVVYTYDLRSAYLYFSRLVPSPFKPPYNHHHPHLDWVLSDGEGFWEVTMIAHGTGVHPIYLEDKDKGNRCGKRFPKEGEEFTRWLWTGTIKDCIEHGYTLLDCERGYRWGEMSDFMARWSDILWDAYSSVDVSRETLRSIIKSMWVSLPGRFLKQPYAYKLISQQEVQSGDIPIPHNWFHFHKNWEDLDVEHPPKFLTNWYVRAEYDKESTALTPIGAYIVECCRREVYHLQREEELRGNIPLGSYTDSVSFAYRAEFLHRVGMNPGDLKEEISEQGWLEMNRFIRMIDGKLEIRAPGFEGVGGRQPSEKRILLLKKYWQLVAKQKENLTSS